MQFVLCILGAPFHAIRVSTLTGSLTGGLRPAVFLLCLFDTVPFTVPLDGLEKAVFLPLVLIT